MVLSCHLAILAAVFSFSDSLSTFQAETEQNNVFGALEDFFF